LEFVSFSFVACGLLATGKKGVPRKDDLEHLIEQKVLDLLGDPDAGLELKQEFKEELSRRLKNHGVAISHQEVAKRVA
jgi:hypothetical protein